MDVIYPRCAGLDVHKQTIVACAWLVGDGAPREEVRTFPTTTSGLLALAEGLESLGLQPEAMVATGAYWKPVWHVLDGHFELVLANAAHVKNVPGRKTDVNDAMWLADLLAHGLIRASFVPPAAVQELRTLSRTRKQFVRERGSHAQRIEKVLEEANLKLSSVISDVLGKSGRAVVKAIIDGETDPQAVLSHIGRVKATWAELLEGLRGRITTHHRFMLKLHLDQIESLDKAIAHIETEVGPGREPFRQAAKLLSTMPGLSSVSGHVVVAEIGIDMSRFATPGHLLSWACLCPRYDESAGKRRSTRRRRGGKWFKTTLVQAAWSAIKVKDSFLQAQFHRLRARRGAKSAVVAVAASMLTAAWRMLRNGTEWHELGAAHFDRADAVKTANRLIRRLQQVGYVVQATPA